MTALGKLHCGVRSVGQWLVWPKITPVPDEQNAPDRPINDQSLPLKATVPLQVIHIFFSENPSVYGSLNLLPCILFLSGFPTSGYRSARGYPRGTSNS
jgi:hypothetical protein